MTDLERGELRLVWEARKLWAQRRKVRVTMDGRAVVTPIVGLIERVSVTGAFIVVDGWHVPMYAVKAFGKPTVADIEAYVDALRALSEAPVESLL